MEPSVMIITLTKAEEELFKERATIGESIEASFHRSMLPLLRASGELRLQSLADIYRGLTPDQQVAALQVIKGLR